MFMQNLSDFDNSILCARLQVFWEFHGFALYYISCTVRTHRRGLQVVLFLVILFWRRSTWCQLHLASYKVLHKLLAFFSSLSINSNEAFKSDTSFFSASFSLVVLAMEVWIVFRTLLLTGGKVRVLLDLNSISCTILISPPASSFDAVFILSAAFGSYLFQPRATPLFFLAWQHGQTNVQKYPEEFEQTGFQRIRGRRGEAFAAQKPTSATCAESQTELKYCLPEFACGNLSKTLKY